MLVGLVHSERILTHFHCHSKDAINRPSVLPSHVNYSFSTDTHTHTHCWCDQDAVTAVVLRLLCWPIHKHELVRETGGGGLGFELTCETGTLVLSDGLW